MTHPGNDAQYDPQLHRKEPLKELKGKRICFLGSSVTEGAASEGVSFVEYLAIRNEMECEKYAVSGTTLADIGDESYVARLRTIDRTKQFDLFICQLSTNDASRGLPLGQYGDTATETVAGAMMDIIHYVREVWNCPIMFYTNPRYDSAAYAAMIELLETFRQHEHVGVIDLWADAAFNDLSPEQTQLYMADPIHPTRAGYLCRWTPKFEV